MIMMVIKITRNHLRISYEDILHIHARTNNNTQYLKLILNQFQLTEILRLLNYPYSS